MARQRALWDFVAARMATGLAQYLRSGGKAFLEGSVRSNVGGFRCCLELGSRQAAPVQIDSRSVPGPTRVWIGVGRAHF